MNRFRRVLLYRSVGSLRRSGARGANSIRFSGRLGKRALRPGLYRAVIRATPRGRQPLGGEEHPPADHGALTS